MAVGFALFITGLIAVAAGLFGAALIGAFALHNAVRPERDHVQVPELFEAGVTGFLYAVGNAALGVPANKVADAIDAALSGTPWLATAASALAFFYAQFAFMALLIGLRHDLKLGQAVLITVSTWLAVIALWGVALAVLAFTGAALFSGANW